MMSLRRSYMALLAVIGWCALGLQLYLIIIANLANGTSLSTGIIRYFSYFTILTNIIAALSLTWPLLAPSSRLGQFFHRATTVAAVTTYMAVVGITYNLLLRSLWAPTGLQAFADIVLHDVVPIGYVLYWFGFGPRESLHWRNLPVWLVYPVIYVIVALILGASSSFYPYPFIDVNVLGYGQTLANSVCILAAFAVVGGVLITINRFRERAIGGTPND